MLPKGFPVKPVLIVALVLALSASCLTAQKSSKKHANVPAAFKMATYVFVQAEDGDETRANLFPEDRRAILGVKDALRTWGRYQLTLRADQADLIFVVRKGRVASVQATAGASVGPNVPRVSVGGREPGAADDPGGDSIGARADAGPSQDLLRVYLRKGDGKRGSQIWTGMAANGLDAPNVFLLRELRDAVEEAYPPEPPAPKQNP